MEYKESEFKEFVVIGFFYNTRKRFKKVHSSWFGANSINLWRGNVWGVFHNGKRIRLKSVYN